MYQVLARKYRPQTFAELIGQEHVRTTLGNAIRQKRIAHGYIFAGQRGTGKTSVARILARCLNCVEKPTAEPCGVCSSCREVSEGGSMDVIEIDAASNRGINDMRELRENVKYRPARDRYKVFIIDEAHQITSEAFNALLKTLEEPPEWVVFLLCTTEAHKIPTTIASRCQQFAFRSVDFAEVMGLVERICRQEEIETDAEVLAVLAQCGEGSVRDSLSALDQAIACCGAKLDVAEIRRLLGMFSLESLHEVTAALAKGDSQRMLEIVQELECDGRNLQHFCRELARYFRNLLVAKVAGAGSRLIAASDREQERLAEIAGSFSEEDLTRYLQLTLDLFRELQFSLQPRLHLEIGLLKLVHAGRLMPIEEALAMVGQGGQTPPPSGRRPPPQPARGGRGKTQASPPPPSAPVNATPPPPADAVPPPPADAVPPPPPEYAPPPPPPPDVEPLPPSAEVALPPAPVEAGARRKLTGWQGKLHAALLEQGLTFIADAVEHSEVSEAAGELCFVAAKEFTLALKSGELQQAVQKLASRPMKVSVTVGEAVAAPSESQLQAGGEDEAERRSLAHPEVQLFQQMFPGSQVRVVRNLKQ